MVLASTQLTTAATEGPRYLRTQAHWQGAGRQAAAVARVSHRPDLLSRMHDRHELLRCEVRCAGHPRKKALGAASVLYDCILTATFGL